MRLRNWTFRRTIDNFNCFRPRVRQFDERVTPDATPHGLAAGNLYQNWNNGSLITTNDDWSGVPSIVGYLGDDTIGEGVDPQTLVSPYSTVNVIANQGVNTALTAGGVAEFDFGVFGTVALQGDATADAPNVVLHLDTTGKNTVSLSYDLVDRDNTADNAVQAVALQYRLGNSGNFTNIPAGFVADATEGSGLDGKVTHVRLTLPNDVANQPLVQVRIITANAVGNDEWVGVDNIAVQVAGNEVPIASKDSNNMYNSDVAVDANGNTWIVWTKDIFGIHGQRFDSAGLKVGEEFKISSNEDANHASVALDADGDAWVVWDSFGDDGDGWSIVGQRYNAAGVKVGGDFVINTFTTGHQLTAAVAVDADGDALVVWDCDQQTGSGFGVFGQRYNAAGVKVGGEFVINTFTTGGQRSDAVAMDADGDAIVVWRSDDQDGSVAGVYGQRFNAAGAAVGGEFPINTFTTGFQGTPSVAMDALGNAVVVWTSYGQEGSDFGVYGQRFDAAGAKVGGEFAVNTHTIDDQHLPDVAVDADGDFLVVWNSELQDGSLAGVFGQRFNALGSKVGGEFQINQHTTNKQSNAAVAVDADGDAVVVWSSYGQNAATTNSVYGRWLPSPNPETTPHVLASGTFNQYWNIASRITANDIWTGVPAMLGFAGNETYGLGVDPQTVLSPGGTLNVLANQGSNTALTTGGIAEFDGLTNRTIALQPSGTADAPNLMIFLNTIGVGNIAISYNLRDIDGSADDAMQPVALQYRVGNSGNFVNVPAGFVADATSGPNLATKVTSVNALLPGLASNQPLVQVRIITTNAVGNDEWVGIDDIVVRTESIVNTKQETHQQFPAVAMDADGDSVVVWEDRRYYETDIYGQRYNAAGAKVGGEFQVNTYSTSYQIRPAVAMDADGDSVVVWQSNGADGSGYGIFGQRFNVAGAKVGAEFQVNTYTTGTQRNPAVAMDADGDFLIVWTTSKGGPEVVWGQRFDAAGAKVGGEFRVDTYAFDNATFPAVALDGPGNALVVWVGGLDGGGTGIQGQRFDPAGAKIGGEFLVNTGTTGGQQNPTVAMNANGDTVVAWQSQHSSTIYDIYAQRFNAAGAKVGGEFQANTFTTERQIFASAAIDADGDMVIAWSSYQQDGSNYGIYGQRFNSAGNKIGSEFPINIYTTSGQRNPAVAVDADGDALVVWDSFGQAANGYEIIAQRLPAIVTPPRINNVVVNHASPGAQRSMVKSLQITFSSPVSFNGGAATAFTLVNQKTSAPVTLAASMDMTNTVVTLTFTGGSVDLGGSLADGRYTLTTLANQFAGLGFDGNNDGQDGDDYVLVGTPDNGLFRLFGDADGDGTVAANDFIQFRLALGGSSPIFDFDGDGAVAASDFIQFRLRFGGSV